MKTSKLERKHGIQWTARNQLEDLDFTDDLTLLSHTHEQMQMKTTSVAAASAAVGLNIHKGKTKTIKYNMENIKPITLVGETLEEVKSFTIWKASSMKERDRIQTLRRGLAKQGQHFYSCTIYSTQNNCQPISK
ncbi:unnamed protein product [Schistosoma curassoni]|uniref:Reverse transcriptase domain-containing protein n=1 Tax=Schistosoma curassoni TaxID=6186 RepID=A0A183KIV5_9TREM|nr:unnamed protein product [Schistosoma curassoni]